MTMYDSVKIRRRIVRINGALALVVGAESISGLWFLLGGRPGRGWLRGIAEQSPAAVAVAVALAFGGLLVYHRPHPLPSWALPDDWTVPYGLGLAVFCGVGVIGLAIIRIVGG
jgi:hypothetical protein